MSRRWSGAEPGLGTYIPSLPPPGRRTFKLYCAVLMHTTDAKTKANYGWWTKTKSYKKVLCHFRSNSFLNCLVEGSKKLFATESTFCQGRCHFCEVFFRVEFRFFPEAKLSIKLFFLMISTATCLYYCWQSTTEWWDAENASSGCCQLIFSN